MSYTDLQKYIRINALLNHQIEKNNKYISELSQNNNNLVNHIQQLRFRYNNKYNEVNKFKKLYHQLIL